MQTRMTKLDVLLNAYYVMRRHANNQQITQIKPGILFASFISPAGHPSLLCSAVSDVPISSMHLLKELLVHIHELQSQEPNITYYIPLAECHKRRHWVLLTIQNNQAKFYDPMPAPLHLPPFFHRYDLNPIGLELQKSSILLKKENIHYVDIQSRLDGVRCGYYITHMIEQLFLGNGIDNIKKTVSSAKSLKNYLEMVQNEYPNEIQKMIELYNQHDDKNNQPVELAFAKFDAKSSVAMPLSENDFYFVDADNLAGDIDIELHVMEHPKDTVVPSQNNPTTGIDQLHSIDTLINDDPFNDEKLALLNELIDLGMLTPFFDADTPLKWTMDIDGNYYLSVPKNISQDTINLICKKFFELNLVFLDHYENNPVFAVLNTIKFDVLLKLKNDFIGRLFYQSRNCYESNNPFTLFGQPSPDTSHDKRPRPSSPTSRCNMM